MLHEPRFVGLKSGKYTLDGKAIIDQTTGGSIVRAEKRKGTAKNDRYYLRVRDENLAYFMHDKTLGSLDSPTLEAIAWDNVERAGDVSDDESEAAELRAEYYELAASAFLETAFVQTFESNELIEGVDERLEIVDRSEECLQLAIASLSKEQTSTKHRLQVKLLFDRVHRDIVCGEIIDETVDELIENLYKELFATFDDEDQLHARGLAGEIRALWHYWSEFKETGLAAIPATVRGDSGFYNGHDTHDFDLLSQRKDGNWQINTPREIKRRKIQEWMKRRYTGSDLVYVSPLHGVVTVQEAKKLPKAV